MSADSSGHTADHIMMKIPIPLASAEVEAVSRRARDRWFQQDSTTVAAAGVGVGAGVRAGAPSSRSSSPTNDTVYAAATSRGIDAASAATNGVQTSQTAQAAQVVNITARDALDHGCRCRNCNEWIMGKRFQCANCPSEPEPYNLVRGLQTSRTVYQPCSALTRPPSAPSASSGRTGSTTPATCSSSLTAPSTSPSNRPVRSYPFCTNRARVRPPLGRSSTRAIRQPTSSMSCTGRRCVISTATRLGGFG